MKKIKQTIYDHGGSTIYEENEGGKDVDNHDRWIDDHLKRIMALEAAAKDRQQDEDAERAAASAPADSLVGAAIAAEAKRRGWGLRFSPFYASRIPSHPADSLVEGVADIIDPDDPVCARGTARAAIREVAAWLRSEYPKREGYGYGVANLIEKEANR